MTDEQLAFVKANLEGYLRLTEAYLDSGTRLRGPRLILISKKECTG